MIIAPISGEVIKFMGKIYINNTDMLVILPDVFDCKTLILEAQQSLDALTHLLNATGGALNPEKCYWYLVDYKYVKGVWTYKHRSNFNLSTCCRMVCKQQSSKLIQTKPKLGVWSTPSGNNSRHL